MPSILRQRKDTDTAWATIDPVIPDGQLCFDSVNHTFRIGNGADIYSALPVQSGPTGATGPIGSTGLTGDVGSPAIILGTDTVTNILLKPNDNTGDVWIASDSGVDDVGTAVVAGDGLSNTGTQWIYIGQIQGDPGTPGAGTVASIVGGLNITVNSGDPTAPIVNGPPINTTINSVSDTEVLAASQASLLAPKASPTFTGTVTLPTNTVINIVNDVSPQLGGALDSNGKTINESSVRQIPNANVNGSYFFDYSQGDMIRAAATSDLEVNFSNFPTGLVCAMIIDAVNWGNVAVTYAGSPVFAGGTVPEYTAGGTDRILVTKDSANVYAITVIAKDMKASA